MVDPLDFLNSGAQRKVACGHETAHVAFDLHDLTIGDLIEIYFPDAGFRMAFGEHPFLDQVRLRDVLATPLALNQFLSTCRALPHCSEITTARLRHAIEIVASLDPAEQSDGPIGGRVRRKMSLQRLK